MPVHSGRLHRFVYESYADDVGAREFSNLLVLVRVMSTRQRCKLI